MLTKKPHSPRTEKSPNELLTISNFKEVEPYLVENILPILNAQMINQFSEATLNVGKLFVKNFSVPHFPIIKTLFNEMKEESK